MNLLEKIQNDSIRFTQHERRLIAFIQAKYPHCLLESATSIAKQVDISASTVVRFFAKLGYESFHDAQREIRLEIASKLSSPSQRVNLTIHHEQSVASVLAYSIELDKQNIESMRANLNLSEFENIVERITSQKEGNIYIIAAKNSQAVSHYLATHLNMCVANVVHLNANDATLADKLLRVTSKDLLLAFSIRRYSKAVLRTGEFFSKTGADVISFTDSPTASIAKLSQHHLLIHTLSASPFDSYTATFTLFNALTAAVALKNKKETESILLRGEGLWKHFDIFAG